MFDTTIALQNIHQQVRWKAMQCEERLSLLFVATPVRRPAWVTWLLVSLGHLLIFLGRRLTNEPCSVSNLQPSTSHFRP